MPFSVRYPTGRRQKKKPPGETPGGCLVSRFALSDLAEPIERYADYWAALIRSQWLVLEPEVPGKVQLSTTSGLNITVSRK